jgi:hypothetical protein
MLVATQVADGGLWHAGQHYEDGGAATLCGRQGWVDHLSDGTPMPASLETGIGVQVVECLVCDRVMRATA